MSDKFVEIAKQKMAEIKKQREQDKGKTAPEFKLDREPRSEPESGSVKH